MFDIGSSDHKPIEKLEAEIEMLRQAMRAAFNASQAVDDPRQLALLLSALANAAGRIARLLQVRAQLGVHSKRDEALELALDQMMADLENENNTPG
jgi:hypothetical protein